MKRLLDIRMVCESWPSSGGRRGWRRSPGFSQAFVEGEARPRYFTEDYCPNSIVAQLKLEGVDTSDFERGMSNWVKTGQGFDVISGKNCS